MKIRMTALLAAAALVLTLASCGDKEASSVRPMTIQERTTAATEPASAAEISTEPATYHERHDYEDGVLVGHWKNDEADIMLSNSGKVTAMFDISEIMMIDRDGTFMLSGDEQPKSDYDGSTLTLYTYGEEEDSEPIEFLTLSRADEPDPDSYDGVYNIETADFKERLAGLYVSEDTSDIDVQINIKYGKFRVSLSDFCDYTQNGDEFTLSLPDSLDGSVTDELSDSTFVLEGDSVTFYSSSGVAEQFVKAE